MTSFGEIINAAKTQSEDEFVNALIAALPPIYDKESPETVLRTLYRALAKELVKVDITLESVENNNYLSVSIINEILVRGQGALDRLGQENAFKLDEVRLTPKNSKIYQNTALVEGDNLVQLYYVPEAVPNFVIFDTRDTTQAPVEFVITFNPDTNAVTIQATRNGIFTISYQDTGNAIRTNENVTTPIGLFNLGWDEGSFSDLGWSE